MTHKETAIEFLRMVSEGDVDSAFLSFVAHDFRHHNPHFEGSKEALMAGMKANAQEFPAKRYEPIHAISEAHLVAVHGRAVLRPDAAPFAVTHVFRFENNKIAELWDIAQESPADSPNQYGMF